MAMLGEAEKKIIDDSVLCWLATVADDGTPRVSPKQLFTHHDDALLIANIASPNSVRNVRANPSVCVSMVDVFLGRGFKFFGEADYHARQTSEYAEYFPLLGDMLGSEYKILGVFRVAPKRVEMICEPSYTLFPELTEAQHVARNMKDYGVKPA